jgi:hypothetical protein
MFDCPLHVYEVLEEEYERLHGESFRSASMLKEFRKPGLLGESR